MDDVTPPTQWRVVIGWTGTLLVRLIVPGWILFGAITKVLGATPKSLPRSILDAGESIGFTDHFLLLSVLTAIEFFFIGLMLFIPKVARIAAITILSIFLLVLCVEIYNGAVSCGCLGEHSLDPKVMFLIDFSMLLGIVLCTPRTSSYASNRKSCGPILFFVFVICTWSYTFVSIHNARNASTSITEGNLPVSW